MIKRIIFFVALFVLLTACNSKSNPTKPFSPLRSTSLAETATVLAPTASPSPRPLRQLNICMPATPDSLFLYGDSSQAARTIREAIYDGPIDQQSYSFSPVILEELPSQAAGSMALNQVQVSKNDLIIDSQGDLINLAEGVTYLPSGCADLTCAQTYSGDAPVTMDG